MSYSVFLKTDLFVHLELLKAQKPPRWGKMNAQQMVEHLAMFVCLSTEKVRFPLAVSEDEIPQYKKFLLSDKLFRENTKAPSSVLGETPMPVVFENLDAAIKKLHEAIDEFFNYFSNNLGKKTLHPTFGWLNYDEWLILHYKHAYHHLRQFELIDHK